MKQRGVLLVFKPGAPADKIRLVMDMVMGSGLVDTRYYVDSDEKPVIEEFDPNYGGPVWYIP